MNTIIQNAVYIPEKKLYLQSTHVHDFNGITLNDGKEYFVDGGHEYIRRAGDLIALRATGRVIDYSLYITDSFTEKIIPYILWGTYGKDGKSPRTYQRMATFATEHLQNILANCPHASVIHRLAAHHILSKRPKISK